jgi:hypothetical protein
MRERDLDLFVRGYRDGTKKSAWIGDIGGMIEFWGLGKRKRETYCQIRASWPSPVEPTKKLTWRQIRSGMLSR